MNTDQWRYLFGEPNHTADFKTFAGDFVVREQLGYAPCGEGEHIYLWVRKTGLNTAFVAEQIAKFTGLPLRTVTYAGRKDKHAVTEQWFSVHKPGKSEFDWQRLALEGVEVLKSIRHNKKLRTGVLKANKFEIFLRNLSGSDGLEARLTQIADSGVPNYFGQQRFGDSRYHAAGGNLMLAEKMLAGEEIRNRNKRSMAISAMRAWLFNEFVSARIQQDIFNAPLPGDVFVLNGSNSFFTENSIEQSLLERISQGDIMLSAPMWGKGLLASQDRAKTFEQQLATSHREQCELLEALGLKQERRAVRLHPKNLTWNLENNTLNLSFELPSGSFATSVLRELIKTSNVGNEQ